MLINPHPASECVVCVVRKWVRDDTDETVLALVPQAYSVVWQLRRKDSVGIVPAALLL